MKIAFTSLLILNMATVFANSHTVNEILEEAKEIKYLRAELENLFPRRDPPRKIVATMAKYKGVCIDVEVKCFDEDLRSDDEFIGEGFMQDCKAELKYRKWADSWDGPDIYCVSLQKNTNNECGRSAVQYNQDPDITTTVTISKNGHCD